MTNYEFEEATSQGEAEEMYLAEMQEQEALEALSDLFTDEDTNESYSFSLDRLDVLSDLGICRK